MEKRRGKRKERVKPVRTRMQSRTVDERETDLRGKGSIVILSEGKGKEQKYVNSRKGISEGRIGFNIGWKVGSVKDRTKARNKNENRK